MIFDLLAKICELANQTCVAGPINIHVFLLIDTVVHIVNRGLCNHVSVFQASTVNTGAGQMSLVCVLKDSIVRLVQILALQLMALLVCTCVFFVSENG